MDDHISIVLSALAVVANGELVSGVYGEKFARGLGIKVEAAGFFTVAADLTSLGGMVSLLLSLTSSSSLLSLSSSSLLPLVVPSSPFS
jgi:hypothetical protein